LGLDILNEKKLPRAISEGIDEGCLLIGVNLRPLWAKYSKSELNLEDVENKYLEELASAMSIVTESCSNEVKFVFFPMNPDQYGFSDLETAYKLEMKLKSNINYYIVEYEPDIEEVMSLLKSLDAVVSMRFHGCIFSLSNNLNNVIGLDYQVGKKGKVTELMEDLKLNDNVISIESLQSEKLASTLLELLDK
jgi:polysaccharide pyruvyl transferase WcaK-like protein